MEKAKERYSEYIKDYNEIMNTYYHKVDQYTENMIIHSDEDINFRENALLEFSKIEL